MGWATAIRSCTNLVQQCTSYYEVLSILQCQACPDQLADRSTTLGLPRAKRSGEPGGFPACATRGNPARPEPLQALSSSLQAPVGALDRHCCSN